MLEKDKPREKLLRKGAATLSDKELLAILLGSGIKGHDVFQVAKKILKTMDEERGTIRIETLRKIPGVGPARACTIIAALEFSRRRIRPEGVTITSSADVLPLIRHYADRKQEHFISVSLNGANEVIKTRVVTVGLVNQSQVHPREVFAGAITDRATALVVAHNHPSGHLKPSVADIKMTMRLKESGEILGIKLLDHIIFTQKSHYSLLDYGEL